MTKQTSGIALPLKQARNPAFSLVEPKRSVVPAKAGIHLLQGFSLVELSIVLVILGLLTGGILAGQSLIRASQLRAVTTEYQRYTTAVQSFRDKYFAIPGDMNNATAFWGYTGGTGCTNSSGTAITTPGTCDGNGSGNIDAAVTASQSAEPFQFWRQLALAGLVEGSYTGLNGGAGSNNALPGTNEPVSKLSNAGWGAYNWGIVGTASMYTLDYGNAFEIGASSGTAWTTGATMKPEEAWNIDTKMDDGKPGYGKVIAYNWNNACATGGASNSDLANSVYNLSSSATQCALFFTKQF